MAAVGAFASMAQAEDLKAFERKLVEYISSLGPTANKWRLVLIVTCFATASTGWSWALDHQTSEISFLSSLVNHRLFALNLCILIILFLFGAHKRIVAQNIILARSRKILEDFNMSCDDRGRLILKPRLSKDVDSYHKMYQGHG
ncbi:nuclear envelope phosphatase-regulatory subunit 1-like [Hydractinia symbiolongicarpus]|uniref:nuclear envelope phosphatase-regulatory subunit 1-like n=1 Tax=Hydractinia symbiolongicarpus TaxID=13093 RepID=UPI00254A05D8|nr:nuclear envelope phosphatase-regulatory subunit 1-like [Hydractinia symbiolongicarpus]